MKYIVPLCCLWIMVGCTNTPAPDSSSPPTTTTPHQPSSGPDAQQDKVSQHLSQEFKHWFQGLSETPIVGTVSKASVNIVENNSWFTALGITSTQNVVVNASNGSISFSGGGLNGALVQYVKTAESQTDKWQNLVLPDGTIASGTPSVPAGGYAISDVSFGKIYHAVGPQASQVGTTDMPTLVAAQAKVKTLYYDMLDKANKAGMNRIVLPAISTAIFAGAGKEKDGQAFTEAKFIATMYTGMREGIEQFVAGNSGDAMSIVLNRWDPE